MQLQKSPGLKEAYMSSLSRDLTQGPIANTLYKLTAPMVVGIFAIFLFNLVDMYFIGLLGTEPLAAVSFTFPITMTVMNLAIGLSIGTGAVIARAFGQKDLEAVRAWVNSALGLALIVALSVCSLVYVFQEDIYALLGADESLIPLISEYLNWWLLGGFLLVILIVINATVRASGNTKLPSVMMMVAAAMNGILDPLLIFGLGPFPELGVAGAAIATVISWFAALIFISRKMIADKLLVLKFPQGWKDHWKKLLSLAVPAAMTNMLVPIANGVLIALVADYGTHAVAAYGVGMRLEPIAMIVIMALTAALPPFVGQNYGAGLYDRIDQGLWKSIQFLLIWQLLVYGIMAINAVGISSLFSDEPEVQRIIQLFLYILPLSYVGAGFALVTNATLNALHHPRVSLSLSFFRLFVLFVPMAYVGHLNWGLEGLLIGSALGNIIMGFIVVGLFWYSKGQTEWRAKLFES